MVRWRDRISRWIMRWHGQLCRWWTRQGCTHSSHHVLCTVRGRPRTSSAVRLCHDVVGGERRKMRLRLIIYTTPAHGLHGARHPDRVDGWINVVGRQRGRKTSAVHTILSKRRKTRIRCWRGSLTGRIGGTKSVRVVLGVVRRRLAVDGDRHVSAVRRKIKPTSH